MDVESGSGDLLPPIAAAIVGSAMDAIIIIDPDGRVLAWNVAAQAIFGQSSTEAVGADLADLIIPPWLRDAHRGALRRLVDSRSSSALGRRIEVTGQRADGSTFPVELTITQTELGGALMFTGYLRDITERRQLNADLQESRRRLVGISDQTRRRLERDLHDGAQQQLVSVALTLAAARELLAQEPDRASELIGRAEDLLADGIEQLRTLARGLHPTGLTKGGLPTALRELVRHASIQVTLDVALDQRLGAEVESTLYFVAAEGLTNSTRYGATSATITVRIRETLEHSLQLQRVIESVLSDDGPGGAAPAPGSGLAGLMDRVAAVGGTLTITSPPGRGTILLAAVTMTHPEQR